MWVCARRRRCTRMDSSVRATWAECSSSPRARRSSNLRYDTKQSSHRARAAECERFPVPRRSQAFDEEEGSDAKRKEWVKGANLRPIPPRTPEGFLQVRVLRDHAAAAMPGLHHGRRA